MSTCIFQHSVGVTRALTAEPAMLLPMQPEVQPKGILLHMIAVGYRSTCEPVLVLIRYWHWGIWRDEKAICILMILSRPDFTCYTRADELSMIFTNLTSYKCQALQFIYILVADLLL